VNFSDEEKIAAVLMSIGRAKLILEYPHRDEEAAAARKEAEKFLVRACDLLKAVNGYNEIAAGMLAEAPL
jgi:hypothetical protein